MADEIKIDESFDLGTWLGRKQAFAAVAGRCSAAYAECLRTIRQKKLYRARGVTWRSSVRNMPALAARWRTS
jgi:hypothetical protein